MKKYKLLSRYLCAMLACLSMITSTQFTAPFVLADTTVALPITNDAAYRRQLSNAGFPNSYIDGLAYLHSKYPNWIFEPVSIHSNATWNIALSRQTSYALISSDYHPLYRWTDANGKYETGDLGWFRASSATVAYFMDPRNFLNPYDIFQFESAKIVSDTPYRLQIVQKMFAGTFFDGICGGSGGKSYAQVVYDSCIDTASL